MILSSADISKTEYKFINDRMEDLQHFFGIYKDYIPMCTHISNNIYEASYLLWNLSSIIDPNTMYSFVWDRGYDFRFNSLIVLTNVLKDKYLQDD